MGPTFGSECHRPRIDSCPIHYPFYQTWAKLVGPKLDVRITQWGRTPMSHQKVGPTCVAVEPRQSSRTLYTYKSSYFDFVGKVMKSEHSQLSREAHDCADSIPELNKMIVAVQLLGMFVFTSLERNLNNSCFLMAIYHSAVVQCEDLKLKYSEEIAKRKKLYNQVLETKGTNSSSWTLHVHGHGIEAI